MPTAIRCLALSVALLLGACTATSEEPRSAARGSTDCFFARSLRSWRPLDDRNLIVFANGRQPHHVELVAPMPGMSRNFAIGLFDRDGLICPGDSVVARDALPNRIRIRSIRRVTEEELEALYVQYGLEPAAIVELRPIELETEDGAEPPGAAGAPPPAAPTAPGAPAAPAAPAAPEDGSADE